MKKKYDIQTDETCGFYEYNKPTFLIKKSDKRYKEAREFKKEYGFSEDETWSLYTNIALFVLPRLKHFKEVTIGCPSEMKNINEWYKVLDKMIWSFELIAQNQDYFPTKEYIDLYKHKGDITFISKQYQTEIEEGIQLFGKYFMNLWW